MMEIKTTEDDVRFIFVFKVNDVTPRKMEGLTRLTNQGLDIFMPLDSYL